MSHVPRISSSLFLCLPMAASLGACAPSMPAVEPIHLSQLDEHAPPTLPLVLEVREGDRIPVRVKLSGNLIESPADVPPITLTAKRRFFVVIDEDGPRGISLDGKTLGGANQRGSLSLGIRKKDDQPAEVLVELEQYVGAPE